MPSPEFQLALGIVLLVTCYLAVLAIAGLMTAWHRVDNILNKEERWLRRE